MDNKKFKQSWEKIIEIYKEDLDNGHVTPQQTAERIITDIGLANAKECFATVARIKEHDGRIYGENRKWANTYPINSDILLRENRWMLPNLDAIHTTHIDQVMTHIRTTE